MPDDSQPIPPPVITSPAAPRFQFRFRTLLVLITLAAALCALLFAAPAFIAIPLLFVLTIAFPALLTVAIIYSRGALRAFCIGALFPVAVNLYGFSQFYLYYFVSFVEPSSSWWEVFADFDETHYGIPYAITWAISLILGLVSVALRHWLLRSFPPQHDVR